MKIEIEGIGIVEVPDEFGDLGYGAQENYVAQIKEQINAEKSSEEDIEIESDAEELSLLEKLQGGARGFAQGLTFGFADEIEAGLKTGGGFLGDYSKSVKQIRDDIDEVRRKAPGLALGSELTGAVLPSLAAGLFSGGTGTVAGLGATGARVASGAAKAQQAAKAAVGLDKAKKAEAVTKAVSDPSLLRSHWQGRRYWRRIWWLIWCWYCRRRFRRKSYWWCNRRSIRWCHWWSCSFGCTRWVKNFTKYWQIFWRRWTKSSRTI